VHIGHGTARLLWQWIYRAHRGAVLLLGLCVVAQPAAADVIEIDAGGSATIYAGPGIFRDGTFTALAIPTPAPASTVDLLLSSAASRYGLDPDLLSRVAWAESHHRADARSPKGAVGVMQLMDQTARDLGVDRHDLAQNILGGAAYLRQMLDRYQGNVGLALAAYNAGPANVDRYGGVPPFPETRAYLKTILGSAAAQASSLAPNR
jgi:soluble lytic murein transglycosylase-like protein